MNMHAVYSLIIALHFSECSSEGAGTVAVGYAFSTYALQRLVAEEQRILPLLADYLAHAQNHLEAIKRYTVQFGLNKTEHDDMQHVLEIGNNEENLADFSDSEEIFTKTSGDPIESFKVVQRLAQELPIALYHLELDSNLNRGTLAKLKMVQSEVRWPNDKDLADIKTAILRLHQTFNLRVSEMATGRLRDVHTNSGLGALHLYELGVNALRGALFTIAFEYFDASRALFNDIDEESAKILQVRIAQAADLHDKNLANGVFLRQRNPYHFESPIGNIQGEAYGLKRPINQLQFWQQHYTPEEVESRVNFDALCRNGDLRDPMVKKDLYCEFLRPSSTNPSTPFQRVKLEWLNLEPKILQIRDFLTDGEVEDLRSTAEPFLERSGVARANASDTTYFGRTSSSTFIQDSEVGSRFNYISRRISGITGLVVDLSSSEDLQIANYSPGGFYGPHYDAHADGNGTDEKLSPETVNNFLMGKGDRIATFMIYLSDVEAGGGTAFPKLNFAAEPIRRSAIFWYNLEADGTLAKNSLHGGCPILYGSKFIANKWIRADSQMFLRKCPKEPTRIQQRQT